MSKLTTIAVERTTLRVLIARISEQGDFVFSGHENMESQDIGDPTGRYAGDIDYRRTVPADYKDTMLLWLVKERFETDSAFEDWLDTRNIPSEFHNA